MPFCGAKQRAGPLRSDAVTASPRNHRPLILARHRAVNGSAARQHPPRHEARTRPARLPCAGGRSRATTPISGSAVARWSTAGLLPTTCAGAGPATTGWATRAPSPVRESAARAGSRVRARALTAWSARGPRRGGCGGRMRGCGSRRAPPPPSSGSGSGTGLAHRPPTTYNSIAIGSSMTTTSHKDSQNPDIKRMVPRSAGVQQPARHCHGMLGCGGTPRSARRSPRA